MSVRAFGWAWEVKGLTPTQRCVLLFLAEKHNKNTGLVCPAQKVIAEHVEISIRAVRDALDVLEQHGVIERRMRSAERGRGRQSDQYRLACDQPEDVLGWLDDQPAKSAAERSATNRQLSVDQPAAQRLTNRQPASGSIKEEPELEPEENRSVPSERPPAANRVVAAYVDEVRARGGTAPRQRIGQLARLAKELLDAGAAPAEVERAAVEVARRGRTPGALDLIFNELRNGAPVSRLPATRVDFSDDDYAAAEASFRRSG